MQFRFSQAVDPKLDKRNGIHISPKAKSNAFACEDAVMDTEEWKEEESEEGRGISGQKAVYKPSKEEWDEHERSHIPFRKWCPFCVRGKCKGATHKRTEKSEE